MKNGICAIGMTVPQKDIYYISWNIDAAEGIGFLQTDDPKAGKITIFTPLSQLDYIYSFIDGLRAEGIKIIINDITDSEENSYGE